MLNTPLILQCKDAMVLIRPISKKHTAKMEGNVVNKMNVKATGKQG
jgi:hypothetical protein